MLHAVCWFSVHFQIELIHQAYAKMSLKFYSTPQKSGRGMQLARRKMDSEIKNSNLVTSQASRTLVGSLNVGS